MSPYAVYPNCYSLRVQRAIAVLYWIAAKISVKFLPMALCVQTDDEIPFTERQMGLQFGEYHNSGRFGKFTQTCILPNWGCKLSRFVAQLHVGQSQ